MYKCEEFRQKKLIGISVVCIKGDREGSQGTKSLREREHCRAPANNKSFKMCLIQHKIVKKKGFKKFYFMFLLCIPPPPTSSLHFQEAIKHLLWCDAPKLYKSLRTNGISEKLLLIQIYSDSAFGHLSTAKYVSSRK